MEVRLELTIDEALHCHAHWSIHTRRYGFTVTEQAHGELNECLQVVRRSVNKQLELTHERLYPGMER